MPAAPRTPQSCPFPRDHHHQRPADGQPRVPPARLRHGEFHRRHRAGALRPGRRLLRHQVHQVKGQHLPNADLIQPGGRCPRPPQVKRPLLVSPCPQPDCPPAQTPPPRLC
ncbi:hypothetical protein Nmel_017704, partial [Mimus melanotis]